MNSLPPLPLPPPSPLSEMDENMITQPSILTKGGCIIIFSKPLLISVNILRSKGKYYSRQIPIKQVLDVHVVIVSDFFLSVLLLLLPFFLLLRLSFLPLLLFKASWILSRVSHDHNQY